MKPLEVRRMVTLVEDRIVDNGRPLETPVRVAVAVAVIKNPWEGRGFVEDLSPEIDAHAPLLGRMLAERVLEAIGDKGAVEAFGKGAMVGLGGEIEHAAGLVHTLKFGNVYRELVGGTRLLRSCDKRGAPGAGIDLPLQHIRSDDARGHYQNIEVRLADAPASDEILVCLSAATGGRNHPRIGNRTGDEKQMGRTYTGEPVPG